ncbi:hypothetical protein EUGRSUZ_I00356 [Eucalyptus grandis]|uniref:Uncharacterized protein n=2 Tax=Eucalyptus grandis TaxID=71139 RepID=A0ACC3JD41_EUCGR|nr:hypothetical protein EUGRSUZ_I00356 [Eucalyptus grandis]
MASSLYASFVPSLLCALFVVCVLKFGHSKALTNVSCIGAEREALMKFKQNLTDPLRRLGSWTGEDCCKWEGVECSKETGHISKLDLHNPRVFDKCSLGGKMHPALNELKYLKYVDFSFNNFSTEKAQESFTSLQKLEYLNLSYAGFGPISNQLSNLSSLRFLDLSGWNSWEPSTRLENHLWLSTLSNLKYLDMSYVSLQNPKGWLSLIHMLSSLEFLIWRGCHLEDSSTSLPVNFTSLRFLDLSQNSMNSSIPPWFQNFSKLEHLDLSNNDLQGMFPTVVLENNQGLRFLDVSSNGMEGEIPKNSSIFCNLQVLSLFSNKFSGGIFNTRDGAFICERSNLKIIIVSKNNFNGSLPNQFENFKDLEFLDLSRNSISGPIPATVGQLSSLRKLYLSFNKLSGNIPESIGQIFNLEEIDIGNNQLDGTVSELHFANLSSLIKLRFYSNELVINVSTSWVPPFQIQEILMSSCKVGPEFPNWLRTQRNILALNMSNASISDEVPHWLPDILSNIVLLDLSNNTLIGSVSRIIGKNMSLLTQVSLSGNNLSGEIPNSLCMSNELSFLDLSKNQLSGRLPQCWRKSRAILEWIALASNKLNGYIPDSLCHLEQLQVLDLHENGLNGVLPKCLPKLDLLCHLADLQYLSLKHNNLSGGIPHCFNNFSRMWANSTLYFGSIEGFSMMVDIKGISIEFTRTLPYLFSIDLSSNALDGQIPEGLMMLARLQNLNLSQNKLIGKIPLNIDNLRGLESLELSNNMLSGEIPSSISNLDFLSHLDLSFNNLSGRVPSGNHLSTLDSQSTYCGNDGLCGAPLLKDCPGDKHNDKGRPDDHNQSEDESNQGDYVIVWFYSGLGPGFTVALMGFCGILHFKQSWRISYIRVVDRIIEKLLIARMITMLWFKRAFQCR